MRAHYLVPVHTTLSEEALIEICLVDKTPVLEHMAALFKMVVSLRRHLEVTVVLGHFPLAFLLFILQMVCLYFLILGERTDHA